MARITAMFVDHTNIIEILKISSKFGKYHEIGRYHRFGKYNWNLENIIEIWKISLKFGKYHWNLENIMKLEYRKYYEIFQISWNWKILWNWKISQVILIFFFDIFDFSKFLTLTFLHFLRFLTKEWIKIPRFSLAWDLNKIYAFWVKKWIKISHVSLGI